MRECLYELLWSTDFMEAKYKNEISILVKSTILHRTIKGIFPTTLLVKRLLFKIADPFSQSQGQYTVKSLDGLIVDVIRCIAWRDLQTMAKGSILEYHWAVMFYHRAIDLLSGQEVYVEHQAIGESRMDLFLPRQAAALEYAANLSFTELSEHHARFWPPKPSSQSSRKRKSAGNYCIPDVKHYRVIHFLSPKPDATPGELEHYALQHHEALADEYQSNQITVVPIGDRSHAIWIGANPKRQEVTQAELKQVLISSA